MGKVRPFVNFFYFSGKERRLSGLVPIIFGQVIKTMSEVSKGKVGENICSERISPIIFWHWSKKLWTSGKGFLSTLSKQHSTGTKELFEEFILKRFLVFFEDWTNEIRHRRIFISGVSKNIIYKSMGTIWEETMYSKTNLSFSSFSDVEHFFVNFFRSFFAGVVKTAYQASIRPLRRKIVFPKICNFLSSSDTERKHFFLPAQSFWQGWLN